MGETRLEALSNDELSALARAQKTALAALQAEYFATVRAIDRRGGFVPRARAGTEAQTFLRAIGVDDPAEDVRIARTLDVLPHLAKALAAGEATRGELKAAEKAVRAITRTVPVDEPLLGRIDTTLTDAARDHAPREFRKITEHLVRVLTHDSADTIDPHELEQRRLVIWQESNGWTGIEGYLPPDTGAWLVAAMDRYAKPHPTKTTKTAAGGEAGTNCEAGTSGEADTGSTVDGWVEVEDSGGGDNGGDNGAGGEGGGEGQEVLPIHDRRSKRQRQADGLALALRLALGADTHNDLDRPHVMIHVRPESPISDEGLSQAWVGRFLCDATVKELRKTPETERLELGYNVRLATPVQRQALIGRDRTCVIPGCSIPAPWCDAHHIRYHSDGGPTDVSNLGMTCGPHHADVHAGIWALEIRDGTVWAKPPKWLDPHQRWRRNNYQRHLKTTEQLALDIHRESSG